MTTTTPPRTPAQTTGLRVCRARRARRWTQGELVSAVLARGVFCSVNIVSRVENGLRVLDLDELPAWSSALGVSPVDLCPTLAPAPPVEAPPVEPEPKPDPRLAALAELELRVRDQEAAVVEAGRRSSEADNAQVAAHHALRDAVRRRDTLRAELAQLRADLRSA